MTQMSLPDIQDVGLVRTWVLPTDDGDSSVTFSGKLLGISSSHKDRHVNHPATDYVGPGQRCPACRWFVVSIFRESVGDRQFLIHFAGPSIVPGEKMRSRREWVAGADSVVETLTTRRVNGVYFTPPAARVLAQAADQDDDIAAAWRNRAVI